MSSSSSIRRPNFNNNTLFVGGANQNNSNNNSFEVRSSSGQLLANYTRQCHKRLTSSTRDASYCLGLDEAATDAPEQIINDTESTTTTNNGSSSIKNDNKINDTSMEQCIILLEPSLKVFQASCIKNDNKGKKKKSKKQKSHTNSIMQEDGGEENTLNEQVIVDEVPPQIIRVARFFPQRWVPMKRALLRPPPSLIGSSSNTTDDEGGRRNKSDALTSVEIGIQYRIRLAKACWHKGLIAAAEYESLRASLDFSKKRKSTFANSDSYGGDDVSKRYKSDKKIDEREGHNENFSLLERVKLSLMRLPTETITSERCGMAWRHVREMLLECCAYWEKQKNTGHNLPRDEKRSENESLDDAQLSPSQVANWTLTAWTALLLSQGLDCTPTQTMTQHPPRDNSIASIEKHLATLLSDRSASSSDNPTLVLSKAVEYRIDDLLSPENLVLLNSIHLYSLGRLLASFHTREDSEMHIIKSILKCSFMSGMKGLEHLARLLAVYTCCTSATSIAQNVMGNKNASTRSGRSTVKELEGRLFAKLNDEESMARVVDEISKGGSSIDSVQHDSMSLKKAKSFLESVFCATAHLVKSSAPNDITNPVVSISCHQACESYMKSCLFPNMRSS